jgi:hypothetical protein
MAKKKRKERKIIEYKLPAKLKGRPTKLILGCDPGSANFGISLVGIERNRPRVYANSVLMHPVNDLINFNRVSQEFLIELDGWMAFEVNGVIAERFQTRGNGGPLIEQVSAMLGLMTAAYAVPIKLTIASAWKNAFNRRFGVDLKEIYPTIEVQPHQLDAALIGIYGLEQGLDLELDYTPDEIIEQVERTSLIPLRKRRIIR